MRYKLTRIVIVVLLGVVIFAYANRPRANAQVPDPRYYVSTIVLTGPTALSGGSSDYTAKITVARNGAALNVGVDGTIELRDGGRVLSWKTFTILRYTNTTTLTLPLSCSGGNVAGTATTKADGSANDPNSGHNSVSLTAHANETDSNVITVSCPNGGAGHGC